MRRKTRVQALIDGTKGLFADGEEGGGGNGEGGGAGGGSGDAGGDGPTADELMAEIKSMRAKMKDLTEERDRLKNHADEILTQRKRDQEKAEELARKAGDVESLEKSYGEKLAGKDEELAGLRSIIENMTAGDAASRLAAEVAVKGSEELVRRWLDGRIRTEFRGPGEPPKLTVYGRDGKPTADTLDDLKKELLSEPALAPVIVGTRAKGAGGPDPKAAGGSGKTIRASTLEKMSAREKANYFAEHPDATVTDD